MVVSDEAPLTLFDARGREVWRTRINTRKRGENGWGGVAILSKEGRVYLDKMIKMCYLFSD